MLWVIISYGTQQNPVVLKIQGSLLNDNRLGGFYLHQLNEGELSQEQPE